MQQKSTEQIWIYSKELQLLVQFSTIFSLLNADYVTNIHLFDGGFLGVDVFFVISGFLVAKGLNSQFDQGTFSLIGFYKKRVARILPPFLIVCIFSLALGYFLVFQKYIKNYQKKLSIHSYSKLIYILLIMAVIFH